jgi:hypothetical protein
MVAPSHHCTVNMVRLELAAASLAFITACSCAGSRATPPPASTDAGPAKGADMEAPASVVRGVVRSTGGTPIAGAEVTAVRRTYESIAAPPIATTQTEGRFEMRFAGSKLSSWSLEVKKAGFATVFVEDLTGEVGVTLARVGTVTGRVRFPTGRGGPFWVADGTRGLYYHIGEGTTFQAAGVERFQREGDDLFRIEVAPGTARLVAFGMEFTETAIETQVTEGDHVKVDIAPAPGRTVQGTVQGPGGKPAARAAVTVQLDGYRMKSVLSDAAGAFSVLGLPEDRDLIIHARSGGLVAPGPSPSGSIGIPAGKQAFTVTLHLVAPPSTP